MAFGAPKIKTISVNSTDWTPLKPGKDCSSIRLFNGSGQTLKLRSTDTDSTTEISIADGTSLSWDSPHLAAVYREEDILFYAQIGTGSANVQIIAI